MDRTRVWYKGMRALRLHPVLRWERNLRVLRARRHLPLINFMWGIHECLKWKCRPRNQIVSTALAWKEIQRATTFVLYIFHEKTIFEMVNFFFTQFNEPFNYTKGYQLGRRIGIKWIWKSMWTGGNVKFILLLWRIMGKTITIPFDTTTSAPTVPLIWLKCY